jgi:hypothetical protein
MRIAGFTTETALYQAAPYRPSATSGRKRSSTASGAGAAGVAVQLQGILPGMDFQICTLPSEFPDVYVVCGHRGLDPIYCPEIEFLGIVCR